MEHLLWVSNLPSNYPVLSQGVLKPYGHMSRLWNWGCVSILAELESGTGSGFVFSRRQEGWAGESMQGLYISHHPGAYSGKGLSPHYWREGAGRTKISRSESCPGLGHLPCLMESPGCKWACETHWTSEETCTAWQWFMEIQRHKDLQEHTACEARKWRLNLVFALMVIDEDKARKWELECMNLFMT